MTPVRRRAHALVPLAVCALLASGCSSSEGGERSGGEASSSPSESASASAEPSEDPASLAVPPLTFINDPSAPQGESDSGKGDKGGKGEKGDGSDDDKGDGEDSSGDSSGDSAGGSESEAQPEPECYAIGKDDPAEVAWFGSAVNVTAAGRLVDVRAVDSPGVQVTVEDTQQVPLAGREDIVGGIAEWPLTEDQVTRFVVVRNASDMLDVDLRANQTLLPVLHLTVQPDSSVGEFVFVYEIANGQRAEVAYPADLEFAANCGGSGSRGGGKGGEDS